MSGRRVRARILRVIFKLRISTSSFSFSRRTATMWFNYILVENKTWILKDVSPSDIEVRHGHVAPVMATVLLIRRPPLHEIIALLVEIQSQHHRAPVPCSATLGCRSGTASAYPTCAQGPRERRRTCLEGVNAPQPTRPGPACSRVCRPCPRSGLRASQRRSREP